MLHNYYSNKYKGISIRRQIKTVVEAMILSREIFRNINDS